MNFEGSTTCIFCGRTLTGSLRSVDQIVKNSNLKKIVEINRTLISLTRVS